MSYDEILFEQRGSLGIATLNRPKALNAVNLEMYRAFAPQLAAWNRDPSVQAIVLRGNGPKGFCAGGDVRVLLNHRDKPLVRGERRLDFFAEEYELLMALHTNKKPVVALAHGITFGGGAGLAINSAFPVCCESTLVSMPEVFIGSIVDVGASGFYAACPGKMGTYLAMTATRLPPADLIAYGMFRHFVPQARFEELTEALTAAKTSEVGSVIARFATPPPPPPAGSPSTLQAAIDLAFGHSTAEEIERALQEEAAKPEGGAWAKAALDAFSRASPLSLKIALEQIRRGKGLDLKQSLQLELWLISHVLAEHDFYEGVRVVLVDKGQKPTWQFATLQEVPMEAVAKHFAPLPDGDLKL